MKNTAIALIASMSFAPSAFAQSGLSVSTEEARAIAKEAYIFAFPLVMNYRTMHAQAIEQGGFGEWLHFGASSPADTDIVTPNNDTPYSYAWLDLRAEPWVLTMPPIESDRYYTSQWDDLWGYVLDNSGSVKDGNDGHSYMFVGPDWQADTPDGIQRVIRGESSFLGTLTRTQNISSAGGMDRVREIQKSYVLESFSSFSGGEAAPTAPEINWPIWTEGDETTAKFFDYFEFLLPLTVAHPDDKAMYEKMAKIGLGDGQLLADAAMDPAMGAALQAGIDDARAELQALSEQAFDPADFFNTRQVVGTDYINRALGVFVGIFGNNSEQAVYFPVPKDANGDLTDASKANYTVTFEEGNLPPVEYFWSYTMYKLPERLLVENPLDRYSIGSATEGLKAGADGSLTIYISKESPGADKESNWLPAPDGPFWAVLRTYGPTGGIQDGSWTPPSFEPETQDAQ